MMYRDCFSRIHPIHLSHTIPVIQTQWRLFHHRNACTLYARVSACVQSGMNYLMSVMIIRHLKEPYRWFLSPESGTILHLRSNRYSDNYMISALFQKDLYLQSTHLTVRECTQHKITVNEDKYIQDCHDSRNDCLSSHRRQYVRILLSLYRSIKFPDRDVGSGARHRLHLLQTEWRMNIDCRIVSYFRLRISQILQGRRSKQDGIFQRDALRNGHHNCFLHRLQKNEIRKRTLTSIGDREW